MAALEITQKGKVQITFDKSLSEDQIDKLGQQLASSLEKLVVDIDIDI